MAKYSKVDYEIPAVDIAITKFERHIRNLGFSDATILDYVGRSRRYIEFCGTTTPNQEDADRFRQSLIDRRLSRSSINNYSFVMKKYHALIGSSVSLPFIKHGYKLPYVFDEHDIRTIFNSVTNIKYLCMLHIGFYASLRASEVANLDDSDIDLINKTIRIRGGKGDRDALLYLNDICIDSITKYLKRRPKLIIDGRQPLFFSRKKKRYDRKMVYNIFRNCKQKAGIIKPGGVHVFFRHSSATLLLARGCDLLTVKELLRHKDIKTTEK
ncbi:MAG: tyrosine-type recombinase/integrase, partial [Euryarchaeota archaeon]|nr:tyrosine-type recombinase/integrase [Euryarchaeota archaeon]